MLCLKRRLSNLLIDINHKAAFGLHKVFAQRTQRKNEAELPFFMRLTCLRKLRETFVSAKSALWLKEINPQ